MYRIEKPCSEKWDNMENVGLDKFCEKCKKKVFDFSEKSTTEILELLNTEKNVCAKIISKKSILASLSIISILNFNSCSTQNLKGEKIENVKTQYSSIKGKINFKYTEKGIENAEINIITKNKIYRTKSDSLGNFSLNIPTNTTKKGLFFLIEYEQIKKEKDFFQFQRSDQIVFSEEQISKPLKIAYHNYLTMGGVLIPNGEIFNLHFLNGEKISERKFDQITVEDNGLWIKLETNDEIKAVVGKNNVDNVYLYFTKDFIEIE